MATNVPTLEWAQRLFHDYALHRQREDIRRLVGPKFGQVSAEVGVAIDAVSAGEEANALFDQAFAARSESDLLHSPQYSA